MTSCVYGLDLQANSICSLYHESTNSQETHKFLISSCSFSNENKIHLLEFDERNKSIECTSVWPVKQAISGMWTSPALSSKILVATASSNEMNILNVQENSCSEPKTILTVSKRVSKVLWDLEGLQNEVKFISGNKLIQVSLDGGKIGDEKGNYNLGSEEVHVAALDPHHPSLALLCGYLSISIFDMRAKSVNDVTSVYPLHGFGKTTAIDFSPSNPNELLSAGTDGTILIHDIRFDGKYTLERKCAIPSHEHTVRRALFNPFHKELLVSCSSEQTMKLFEFNNKSFNCLKCVDEFGDSVMDTCWSSSNPWVFAGVSFNGKVIIDTVPNDTKMQVLLDEKK
ncbi:WD40 repeat protein [Strigomonas culicis]|uniref:WD40 repeat protein n=1 Tax=Strigomonas culicis TaxID=28005 RepID=S9UUS9_9TRYP|nr:WD40 repeat protein [Strigomonas culicis]|eukprot:EPY32643.1 WD40 repeat protein [Strigomonas culicis]